MQDQIARPRTDAELDAIIAASASADIRREAQSLLLALDQEINLRDPRGNPSGRYAIILGALASGIDLDDLPAHLERETAASRQRAKEAMALLDEADARLKARHAVLQAQDGRMRMLWSAIEAAKIKSAAAVQAREQEKDIHLKTSKMVAAAIDAGVDPAYLQSLQPKPLDKELESYKRHLMHLLIAPIKGYFDDRLRRVEKLPDGVRNMLAKMGDCPDVGDTAKDFYREKVVKMLEDAVAHCERGANGELTGSFLVKP